MNPGSDIHLWTAHLHELVRQYTPLFMDVLSPEEIAQFRRFRFEKSRLQYLGARGMLRIVMARYLQRKPENINFSYGRRGKPYIDGGDLCFNLSHSQDCIILGLTNGRSIGVDIEYIYPLPNMRTIAQTHFSEYEQQVLFTLPSADQQRAFFTCWTRKEAYIKAVGDGFAMPLQDFDVTFKQGEPPFILRAEDPRCWQLYDNLPDDDYVSAVCVQSTTRQNLSLFDFHE